jgi:hypothetical protein
VPTIDVEFAMNPDPRCACVLLLWLSQSQKRVSGSKLGEQTALPEVAFGSPV